VQNIIWNSLVLRTGSLTTINLPRMAALASWVFTALLTMNSPSTGYLINGLPKMGQATKLNHIEADRLGKRWKGCIGLYYYPYFAFKRVGA